MRYLYLVIAVVILIIACGGLEEPADKFIGQYSAQIVRRGEETLDCGTVYVMKNSRNTVEIIFGEEKTMWTVKRNRIYPQTKDRMFSVESVNISPEVGFMFGNVISFDVYFQGEERGTLFFHRVA